MKLSEILKSGIFKNNPVLVQLVGLCSVLAVTNTMVNSFSMGMAVTAVLIGANLVISIFRNVIPKKVRIPAFIVVIATFVTLVQMIMQAYLPDLYESLGIFIPLIVVNCIILARAESFAYKNKPLPSAVDGLANGLGYTLAVVILGTLREVLGTGTLFKGTSIEIVLYGAKIKPAGVWVAAPGAFILLGLMIAGFNIISKSMADKKAAKN